MRVTETKQLRLGQVNIADIQFDPYSRDDIPQILQGLKYIHTDKALRVAVFALLQQCIPDDIDMDNGRPGMDLWSVFILAALRLNLNCDYDRVLELANNHRTIREMLGHCGFDEQEQYKLQTIKDNIALLTPDILDQINLLVVKAGHQLFKIEDESLAGRCDSFVLETNVHFPTDINLLYDAVRCAIRDTAKCCQEVGLTEWRQSKYNIRQVKKAYLRLQRIKHSTSKNEEKKQKKTQEIMEMHQDYVELCNGFIVKIEDTLPTLAKLVKYSDQLTLIAHWIMHANRQMKQIEQRVIDGIEIPHNEKVFSIFEPHTEWVSKGKAGVPVELGIKVSILEDQAGFILNYQVMQKLNDVDIAVDIVMETKGLYPNLTSCSFDKGYHSPDNQKQLAEALEHCVMPKKGKRNKVENKREGSAEFKTFKRAHSAVESAINALEVHGLDRCPDKGLERFEKYVSLAIVARNLQKIGAELQKRALAEEQRQNRRRRQQAA
jgi:IS5 family transposase